MKQKLMQSYESPCGRSKIYAEADMPIGVFHDFLMYVKGLMVERMVAYHKEEQVIAEAQKKQEEIESQLPIEVQCCES